MNRLLEKLVDGQSALATQMAEKSAFDRSVEKRLTSMGLELKEIEKDIIQLKLDTYANNEIRKDFNDSRRKLFGVILTILVSGALLAYTMGKH
jgi:hypothetical protein